MLTSLMAPPRPVPDDAIPNDPATLNALNGAVTGGIYRANSIQLPSGMTLTLTSSLILVAEVSLKIEGMIALAQNVAQPVNVTLVCLQGSVLITGSVGRQGQAAMDSPNVTSRGFHARAQTAPGVHGGYVKILAPTGTIRIDGEIHSSRGGNAGTARADAQTMFAWVGGAAEAAGGQAGAGGDVLLVAIDGINLANTGKILAGSSGFGGAAEVIARNGKPADARGGPSNVGGSIIFKGLVPGMAVDLLSAVRAGGSNPGGDAGAGGKPSPPGQAGSGATAIGGAGDAGGHIGFVGCAVGVWVVVEAGEGGGGGTAQATGGIGGKWAVRSRDGGSADAIGGKAGPPGRKPQIPLQLGGVAQGTVSQGIAGVSCKGGNAQATGGTGGAGAAGGQGGDSGSAAATGGIGCSGAPPVVAHGPAATAAPAPSGGAVGPTVTSQGT
jgi:hypothetical protein